MFPDVFNPDFFTMRALTASINELPFVPARIGEMGLFTEKPVASTLIAVEKKKGILTLVPTAERGAQGQTRKDEKRTAVALEIPHIPKTDTLLADSILGVRQMGSTDRLITVKDAIDEKLTAIQRDLEFTLEFHRMGAIQGKVYDADGVTVLLDCFTAFGEAEPAEIDFDLDNASPASGALRKKCNQVVRQITAALGNQPFSGVWAPCGDNFWDDLTSHPEVRATYLNQQAASELRDKVGNVYEQFHFAGITFENYRGSGTVAIGTDKCRFVPVGVPELFQAAFAPANHVDAVNKPGLPFYATSEPLPHGAGAELKGQTNPLHLCTRPSVLQRAKRT